MNRYTQTEKKYARWVREGRGQGRLMDYLPWLNVQDVSSRGRSHRVLSATNGRVIHLLSDLEFYAFLILDWCCKVIDIREQYPLNRDVTKTIADELNIRHPLASQTDMVMTSDILVDQKSAEQPLIAIQVKPSSELAKPRVKEKLLIEIKYWESLNIPFQIVTEKNFDPIYIENLRWLHPSRFGQFEPYQNYQEAQVYTELLQKFDGQKLTTALAEIDAYRNVVCGYSLGKVRELVARKYFSFPLDKLHYTLNVADVTTLSVEFGRC